MKAFISFVIGIAVGVALHWYFGTDRGDARIDVQARTGDGTAAESSTNPEPVQVTFDKERIKEELAQSGRVIREKARQAGEAVSDATADARITGAIKAKLLKESRLAALKIDVDTHEGAVTLSGVASSPEEISRAMELAYETEGVRKVVSTLQLKTN